MKRQKERWLTLSFLRFNYHVGRKAAVITVVNASADLGGIFPSKFLDARISFPTQPAGNWAAHQPRCHVKVLLS